MATSSESGLRVPKIPVEMSLLVAGRAPQPVELHLAEHLEHAYRSQHIIDVFDGELRFIPVRDIANDSWTLVNCDAVVWARVELADGLPPVEEMQDSQLYEHRQDASLHFVPIGETDISDLVGELLYSAPSGHSRAGDFLNRQANFFYLWTSAHLYIVNKRWVSGCRELAST